MEKQLLDNYKHRGLRKALVKIIETQGISDRDVLHAIDSVPRHYFLDSVFENHAYENKALPIDEGQTISQPYTVAYQTMKLEIQEGDKILEIGTGSGYQAAILAEMGAQVYSIERHEILHKKTAHLLSRMGYDTIHCFFGDGFKGLEQEAPFDKIIITASPRSIPESLVKQLRVGGRMILPIDQGEVHKMTLLIKTDDNNYTTEELEDFKFVPMLKGAVNK